MSRRVVKYTVIATALAAVVSLGIFATRNDFGLGRNIEVLVNLMRVVSTRYVDNVDADKMLRAGADGITSILDPYTTFIAEEDLPDFETMTTGRYGGVGAIIRKSGEYVVIVEPYRDSPASKAGFIAGDKILAINGEDMKGANVEEVSKRLRGEPNTTVKVTIERILDGTKREYKVQRRRIVIPSIPYAGFVSEGIGYIKHSDFTDKCYDDMRAAIQHLQGKGELKGLILDYRNNGGGVLQSAIQILSLFLPKGTVVTKAHWRKDTAVSYKTEYDPLLPNTPLVILINENSASAAEIVAGAIQDLDRGVLIGKRSFGKGLVQSTQPLGYNNMLKYTVGKYYTPSGRCVQAVEYDEDGRAKPIADSLINEFKTANGRKVYDGGGLMPDKVIEEKTLSSFTVLLYLMNIIDEYCDTYTRKNGLLKSFSADFSISDEEYNEFMTLVEGRDIPYTSLSRRALEVLKEALDREQPEALKAELAAIDAGLKDDKRSLLLAQKSDLMRLINENLVLRAFYNDHKIAYSLPNDVVVGEAIKLLNDKEGYKHIITKQDTQRK